MTDAEIEKELDSNYTCPITQVRLIIDVMSQHSVSPSVM